MYLPTAMQSDRRAADSRQMQAATDMLPEFKGHYAAREPTD